MNKPLLKIIVFCLLVAGAITPLQAQVIDKTPLLHMSFDNVSGTNVINDGTGGALLNGAMNGGASIAAGQGKFGDALQVVGTASPDASVRIANAVTPLTIQPTNTFTVACWIKSTTQGGTWMYQGSGGWGVDNTTFAMVVNNGTTGVNGHAAGGVRNSRGWQQGTTVVDDGNWHHIAFTWDGTNKVQYIDGVVDTWVANQWANTPVSTGNQFWIGGAGTGQADGQVCLNGLIDEAYVFNRALSQSDVRALVDSNTVPVVPVAVTVTPTNGYRGQTFTVTATATPPTGFSVTNARVNLTGAGGSATATLVLSGTPNVFTNTFTIGANSPLGTTNLKVTVIDTEPLAGSASAVFTVLTKPPTNAMVLNQITGTTNVYAYTEASFTFNATNDSPDHVFPMNYAWYRNGTLVSTNPMGASYTFLTTPADNNTTIYCVASVADTNFSAQTVTSATLTMTTQAGALVYTNGLKREFFLGASRQNVELGNVPHASPLKLVTNADFAGGQGTNYAERYSGYFIPPTNGNYVFYVAADDDTDVYLNTTGTDPAGKVLIAQEFGFSGTRNWITAGGNGSVASQKLSTTFTNAAGATPFPTGIPLIGGNLYYFESVHHQGTGGDNWGVTFQTYEQQFDPNYTFLDGAESLINSVNTNIALVTWPGTNVTWALNPANATVFEGDTAKFNAIAVTDGELQPYYTWYLNGTVIAGAGGPDGTNMSLPLVTLANNNAQITVVATTELKSITNGPVTLTVLRAVFEPGFAKEDKWLGMTSRTPIENGSAGTPTFSLAMPGFEQGADGPGGQGDFGMRMSGFFIPPADGAYVFFISSDDDSDLFFSTGSVAQKQIIAQEAGWSGTFSWLTAGGGGSVGSNKRSDQFVPAGGVANTNTFGINLVAGQKYYMEVDHHNGAAGGTHMGVTYSLYGQTDPVNGSAPKAVGTNIGINAVRCNTVTFSQEPIGVTAAIGGYATFSAVGTTDSQLPVATALTGNESRFTNNYVFYQWFKNGVAIPNANSTKLSLGPLEPSDANAVITCQIRALGYADVNFNPIWNTSTPATLTLTTNQQVFEPGYVQHDLWTNQTARTTIENGTSLGLQLPYLTFYTPAFEGPNNGGPALDNYVQRLRGWFMPPATANYDFFINSDDDTDLFLSSDSNPTNKTIIAQETGWSNPLQWLAAGNGSTTQKRSTTWSKLGAGQAATNPNGIALTNGIKYYMEAVQHNGGGGNNVEANYYNIATETAPANGTETKITNGVIGVYVPRAGAMAFTQQPVSQGAVSGANSVTFSAAGVGSSTAMVGPLGNFTTLFNRTNGSVIYQWYKDGVAIPGATSSNYTKTPILPADNNTHYSVGIRSLGYADDTLTPTWSNSLSATLTVTNETVPPLISYVSTFANTNQDPVRFIVDVTFNEWMDATTANIAGNYTVAGSTVASATLASNHRTVELVLNQMPTLPLNITVNNVQDISGNAIAANSVAPINPVVLTFTDIGTNGTAATFGTPGINPAYPSSIWIEATNGFLVSAQGSDIFGLADGFNFGWELKTNDFDVVVRGVSNGHTSNFAKAGLMVREDLTPNSRNWSVINDPSPLDNIQAPDNSGLGANNIEANMRATNNAGTISWKTNTATTIPAYPNAWVRIKRVGSVLTSYASSNQIDWIPLGAYDTATNVAAGGALPAAVYVGLATTAHNNDVSTNVPPFKYFNTADYADYNSSFVAVSRAHLTTSVSGTNVIVSWTPAGGHLEGSPALSGPGVNWQNLGTSNPATVPIVPGTQAQFLRVVTP